MSAIGEAFDDFMVRLAREGLLGDVLVEMPHKSYCRTVVEWLELGKGTNPKWDLMACPDGAARRLPEEVTLHFNGFKLTIRRKP